MSPKYSVIVNIYNTEKYLKECIDAVLSQDFDDYELLLVDDGSTDSSGKICDEYEQKNEHVRVIHTENQGIVLSRKTGLVNAKGEYVTFSDSDDYVENNLISSVDEVIEKTNCDMVFYDCRYIYDKLPDEDVYLFDEDRTIFNNKREIYNMLFSTRINSVWKKCFKRELFNADDINFDYYKGFNRGEDRMLVSHLLKNTNTIFYLHKVLYNYRRHEGSMTSKYSLFDFERVSYSTDEILEDVKAENLYDADTERRFYMMNRYIVSSFLDSLFVSPASKSEKIQMLKECEKFSMFQRAVDPRTDSEFSKKMVLKFMLLRKGMYSTLLNIAKIK